MTGRLSGFLGESLLIVLVVTATSFPILYSRVTWYKTRLGRAVMIQSVTLASAVWLKFILTFFWDEGDREILRWINVGFITMMIIATFKLSYVQWKFLRKDEKEHEENHP